MSSITIEWYSQFAPVLKDNGWYETDAQGYGGVFFRKRIYAQQGLSITVGIVVSPSSWHYCGNISTPGYGEGIRVTSPDRDTEWATVSEFFLVNGLECYQAHCDKLDKEIEEQYSKKFLR